MEEFNPILVLGFTATLLLWMGTKKAVRLLQSWRQNRSARSMELAVESVVIEFDAKTIGEEWEALQQREWNRLVPQYYRQWKLAALCQSTRQSRDSRRPWYQKLLAEAARGILLMQGMSPDKPEPKRSART